ncbi:MAG TPA: hypothetical protein VGF17_21765, partial [Phytomonospora sp.]
MSLAPSRRGFARAAALVGVTALAAGSALLLSTAAQAEDPATVNLAVSVPAQDRPDKLPVVGLPLDGETKDLRVVVANEKVAGTTATGVTLDFKLPAANEAGTVTLSSAAPSTCSVDADGKGSCTLNDLKPGSIANLQLFTVTSLVEDK